MTRWAQDDLTGRLIKSESEPKADKWQKISFPAILPSGKTRLARILEYRRIRKS